MIGTNLPLTHAAAGFIGAGAVVLVLAAAVKRLRHPKRRSA